MLKKLRPKTIRFDAEGNVVGRGDNEEADCDGKRIVGGKRKSEGSVFSKYEVMSILGGSANSGVYLCRQKERVKKKDGLLKQFGIRSDVSKNSDTDDEKLFVMKVLRINTVDPTEAEAIAAQDYFDTTDMIMEISHPHMVKLYEYFERYDKAYNILEYMSGGNLTARCPYSEVEAAQIVSRILSAIKMMHDKGMLHLSLNLENILYTDDSSKAEVKLADFGLSRRIQKLTHVRSAGGAERNYATAPEIFRGQSFAQSDLWSIGVITYILLSRQAPFSGEAMMEQITRCRYDFDDPVWENISGDAKDFISQLLQLDPNKRPTLVNIMKHRWLMRRIAAIWTKPEAGYVTPQEQHKMDAEIRNAKFKLKAINVIAEISSMEDILKIAQLCMQFDESKLGLTTYSEFRLALQTSGYSALELQSIFDEHETEGDARFGYRDFLAATLEARGRFEEIILTEQFERMFESEESTMNEYQLSNLLSCVGTPGRAAELFPEADWDYDEKVSFKEFLHAFYDKTREFSSRIAASSNYSITNTLAVNSLNVLREKHPDTKVSRYKKHGILGGSEVAAVYIVRLDYSLDAEREKTHGLKLFLNRVGEDRNHGKVDAQCDYAMKTYKGTSPETEYNIRAELRVLKELNHKNIVKIYDSFEDYGQVHMVMELCEGGSIASRLPYTEKEAARIISRLLSAVKYMHDRDIKHSAINMETIVFAGGSRDSDIKIINFGLTRKHLNHQRFSSEMTDPGLYAAAPESFRGVYTKKGDVWSVGVITYCLLSSFKPFWGKRWQEKVMNGEYDFDHEVWGTISQEGIDFVAHLLKVDSSARPDASKAMRHAWFRKHALGHLKEQAQAHAQLRGNKDKPNNDEHEEVLRTLREADFKRVALNVIAQRLSDDQIIGLLEYAYIYDENKDGIMTHAEFKEMLKGQKYEHVVDGISLKTKDFEQSGSVNVLEFLNATLMARGHILEDLYTEEIREMEDESGYCRKDKLEELLEATGAAVSIEEIFTGAGLDESEDYIADEEFLNVFRKLHTRIVCSRIKADLVSMTSAVSGKSKIGDLEGHSLSIHARFEKLNRLGGNEAVIFEVLPRGLREAELSRKDTWTGTTQVVRRSHRLESIRSISAIEHELALKIFRLNKYSSVIAKKFAMELKREIKLIEKLDHPYILKVHEMSQQFDHILVLTDLCRGGNLLAHFPFTEAEVSRIIKMILSALEYMHSHRLVHRALNLENILFENEGEMADIKLINFGLSRKYIKSERQLEIEGDMSALYAVPPEGFRGDFNGEGDIWSVGVIAYTMLAGHQPFQGLDMKDKILGADFNFDHPIWRERSRHSQQFVVSLLKPDYKKRPDARRALKHPWFRQTFELAERPPFVENDEDGQAFEQERRETIFKSDALNTIVFNSTAKKINKLRDVLDEMNEGNNGVVQFSDFRKALKKASYESEVISKIFCNVDLARDGDFDYAEFLDKAVQAKGYMVEVKLAEAFDSMESKEGKYISKKQLMNLVGSAYEALMVDDVFDGSGENVKIPFHDFLHLFDRHIESLRDIQSSERSDYTPANWSR